MSQPRTKDNPHTHILLWILVLTLFGMLLIRQMFESASNWIGLIGGSVALLGSFYFVIAWVFHYHREQHFWNIHSGLGEKYPLELHPSDEIQHIPIHLEALEPIDPLMMAAICFDATENSYHKLRYKVIRPRLKALPLALLLLIRLHFRDFWNAIRPKSSLGASWLWRKTREKDTTGNKPRIKSAVFQDLLGCQDQRNFICDDSGVCTIKWEPKDGNSYPTVSKRDEIQITLDIIASKEWRGSLIFQSNINRVVQDTIMSVEILEKHKPIQ